MKVLNLLTSGDAGGIESLCRDIGLKADYENAFCFLFKGGSIYEQMKELGLKTYDLSSIGGKISRKKLKTLKEIAKEYDIIVAHNGEPVLKLYHILLSRSLKKKYVTMIHSCYDRDFEPSNPIKRMINRWVFQRDLDSSHLIVSVSNAGIQSYKEFFKFLDDKVKIVYNGVGEDKLFAGKDSIPNIQKPYNLLYVGRLIAAKGVDLLIKAASSLSKEYPISVSIVGDGPVREKLEELTKELNLTDIVTFYGRQVNVIPFYQQANIFIYPSTWQEVFGISLVEGMSFGLPCVANRVGGIPEIIEDGKSGFLTEETSVNGVVKALLRVIECIENGEIETLSIQAKQRADQFTIGKTVDNLKSIYQELLK